MNFDPQDSKWTAYVLGELNAQERFGIEKILLDSPEARQWVEETRQAVSRLTAELHRQPTPELTPAQHAAIEKYSQAATAAAAHAGDEATKTIAAPPEPVTTSTSRSWGQVLAVAGSLAAVLVIGTILILPAMNSAREATRPSNRMAHNNDDSEQYNSYRTTGGAIDDSRSMSPKSVEKSPAVTGGTALESGNWDKSPSESVDRILNDLDRTSAESKTVGVQPTAQFGAPQHGKDLHGDQFGGYGGQANGNNGFGSAIRNNSTNSVRKAAAPPPAMKPATDYSGATNVTGGTLSQKGSSAEAPAEMKPAALSGTNTYTLSPGTNFSDADPLGGGIKSQQQPGDKSQQGKADNSTKNFSGSLAKNNDSDLALPLDSSPAHDRERDQRLDSRDPQSNESYINLPVNPFVAVTEDPLSTFATDVDTGSYTNIRRYLSERRQLPPPAAVRVEEMLNYFRYDYPAAKSGEAFSVQCEVAQCPWEGKHRLARIGIKGREIAKKDRPVTNLVFLLDVSGSMTPQDRLPMIQRGLTEMVDELTENDRVAVVYYAAGTGIALESTPGNKKEEIKAAINKMSAGGSTNGAGGIQLAYKVARDNFIARGVNRVILGTDGDFNVGITDRNELIKLLQKEAESGVSLTTLGVGTDNLKDATLEQLADKGHGNYSYLDTMAETRRVLVEQINGTLVTIAKDMKVQIEFNPNEVQSYRLIGYENRIMPHADFNNDKKMGGDVGAGHTVTALYELVPANSSSDERPAVDPLKYQKKVVATVAAKSKELFTLKLRYKQPDGDKSSLQEYPIKDSGNRYGQASRDFKFASSVAAFGMALRHNPFKGDLTVDAIAELAQEGVGSEDSGARKEFVELIRRAKELGVK